MALIELNINLNRTADALEKICEILERAYPPIVIPEQEPKKIGKEALIRMTPGQRYDREFDKKMEQAKEQGIPLDELDLHQL